MSTEIKKFIKDVAISMNLTYSEVEEIFYSQFKFVAHTIREDREKPVRASVRLTNFGSFVFVPRSVEIMEKRRNENARQRTDGKTITED